MAERDSVRPPEKDETEISGIRKFIGTGAGKAVVAGAVVLVVGAIAFGAFQAGRGGQSAPEAAARPSASNAAAVPLEAKDFIDAYKDRYSDPLATYYAEAAYVSAHPGQDLTIGPDYIIGYDFEAVPSEVVSPLAFSILTLPLGQEVSVASSVAQFNEAVPNMNRLMNLLAKNPTPDQVAVVKDEFCDYTGFHNPHCGQLAERLAAIVTKHGTSAVYEIRMAADDTSADANKQSVFPAGQPIIDGTNESGATNAFSNSVLLSVAIDSYDNSNQTTSTTEIDQDFQFSVIRAENQDAFNKGFVGIGLI